MCKFNGSWRFLRWIVQVVGEPASPYNESFYTKKNYEKNLLLSTVLFLVFHIRFLKCFSLLSMAC